ncbi:NAD(P)-dependent oxidoreductase [Actinomadura sp. CNU-125]|uniref:NAD(P)-dependent oxidoreductase n=1 Tax=Actinomadura sp. CNU-125 TaxID=1904961 RepID=UPI0021CCB95F|nr:NAD-binding protein [Actinomadura sp. CNU-125]
MPGPASAWPRRPPPGVAVVDAPVSGGGPAAERGELLVMVGGDGAVAERCRPVFETFGGPVVHLGTLGAGQRAKLVNNLLFAANLGVAESAFALARGLGVDPGALSTVLAHGSGGSFGTNMLGGLEGHTLAPLGPFAGALLRKDARLVVDLALAAGAEPGTVLDAADAALKSMGHLR